jgi:two-component system, NtrC family, response regulator
LDVVFVDLKRIEDRVADILIIDDNEDFSEVVSRTMSRGGHRATTCANLESGLAEAIRKPYDVVLLDVQLPDGNGLKAIEKFKAASASPEVIIITGFGDPAGAELAVKWGVWDYLAKPSSPTEMSLTVLRALEYRKEKQNNFRPIVLDRKGIIGRSPPLRACLDKLALASRSDLNVLLTGETGTGKEVFARTLHENSDRSGRPFIVVDCGVLPSTLVESLLFGHRKGAFTGADSTQPGLIKQADGGTLFLDEVGELPLSMQKAFLRVLQEHRFRPVGAKQEEASDFRLVVATNRNLDQMAETGAFRSDLLFRLKSFVIDLPPLRERIEDIKELTAHYLAKACERSGTEVKGFSAEFLDVLRAHDWPGNVRELANTLQSAVATAANEPILYHVHLPVGIRAKVLGSLVSSQETTPAPEHDSLPIPVFSPAELQDYKEFREDLQARGEREYFSRLASASAGSLNEACRISGLSRSRLYFFLHKYSISLRV